MIRTCTARGTGTRSRRPGSTSPPTSRAQTPSSCSSSGSCTTRAATSDGRDREHGPRAAAFAVELHAAGVFALEAERLELLRFALERHAFGEVSDDPRIGACWDADRLHLPRVGFQVDPALLSTSAARQPEALTVAASRRSEQVAWITLVDRLSASCRPSSGV